MWHRLKRHPFAVKARFGHCLALTYAFPRHSLTPLLPPGLSLDTYQSWGFVAIALVETKQLRPSFLPASFGQSFLLAGYRIFARLGAGARRGLYILRSDTDKKLMTLFGNCFTHYQYRLSGMSCRMTEGLLEWRVASADAEADLLVRLRPDDESATLPLTSPFPDLRTARRFAGPLPYTFDYEKQTGSIVSIKGVRSNWEPRVVEVEVVNVPSFFRRPPFTDATPLLANAFYLRDVLYAWERGRVLSPEGAHVRT